MERPHQKDAYRILNVILKVFGSNLASLIQFNKFVITLLINIIYNAFPRIF